MSAYSFDSKLTKQVCELLGYNPDVHFVRTCRRNGKVYVKSGFGKPQEHRDLHAKARCHGFDTYGMEKSGFNAECYVSNIPQEELGLIYYRGLDKSP